MKFYYNGKLVRTSKTHHYTHALQWRGAEKVKSCHGSFEAAVKAKRALYSYYYFETAEKKADWIKKIESDLMIVELEEK